MNKLGIWAIVTITFFLIFTTLSPAAHAQSNENLIVSAENLQFDNYMAGPMVIEVKIVDPDIDDTDEGKGEPDVDVNSGDLRMVQAVDGNWYGYFADRAQAQFADSIVGLAGTGLDFGTFCSKFTDISGSGISPISVSQTVGIALQGNVVGGSQGTTTPPEDDFPVCVVGGGAPFDNQNVIRGEKTINPGSVSVEAGQINLEPSLWPFIQLYDLNPTGSVIIKYTKGGVVQSVTLTFDTVDQFAELKLNKPVYLNNEDVLVTITDVQLNIDPTSKDSWTWGTATSVFYQLFNVNGQGEADGTAGAVDLLPFQSQMMFVDNGILTLKKDDSGMQVVELRDNDIQDLAGTDGPTSGGTISAADQPVTFLETQPNSGVFVNFDLSNVANIAVTSDAGFGKQAIINYNKIPVPIEVSVDDDGDGLAFDIDCDDNDASIGVADTWYRDLDGDGFGDPSNSQDACIMPTGFVSDNTDCNDDDSTINPSATDIPEDGIDQDCDGVDAQISNSLVLDAINTLQTLVLDSLEKIHDSILGLDTRVTELEEKLDSLLEDKEDNDEDDDDEEEDDDDEEDDDEEKDD